MNSFVVVLVAALASAHAGLIPHSAQIIQGPSSRTTIVGNNGLGLTALAPGGSIIAESHPGVVAHTVPVGVAVAHAAPAALSHSVVAHAAPVAVSQAVVGTRTTVSEQSQSIVHPSPVAWAHSAPVAVAHAAPVALAHAVVSAPAVAVAHSAHLGHVNANTVVSGPSGSIVESRAVPAVGLAAHPVAVAHSAPLLAHSVAGPVVSHSLLAHSAPVLAHSGLVHAW